MSCCRLSCVHAVYPCFVHGIDHRVLPGQTPFLSQYIGHLSPHESSSSVEIDTRFFRLWAEPNYVLLLYVLMCRNAAGNYILDVKGTKTHMKIVVIFVYNRTNKTLGILRSP